MNEMLILLVVVLSGLVLVLFARLAAMHHEMSELARMIAFLDQEQREETVALMLRPRPARRRASAPKVLIPAETPLCVTELDAEPAVAA